MVYSLKKQLKSNREIERESKRHIKKCEQFQLPALNDVKKYLIDVIIFTIANENLSFLF